MIKIRYEKEHTFGNREGVEIFAASRQGSAELRQACKQWLRDNPATVGEYLKGAHSNVVSLKQDSDYDWVAIITDKELPFRGYGKTPQEALKDLMEIKL